jgi:predicted RNase H-like HicB family nuclease
MNKYEIVIYWSDDDKAYVAEVPELPGCMADGQSYGEVVVNIQKVIAEWIETAVSMGRTIPVPCGKLVCA